MANMTDTELASILRAKIINGVNYDSSGVSDRRQKMFDRYMGAPEGSERKGYSTFVTREVLEVVEWALPAIVRIFTAGDKFVSFDPLEPGDEKLAEQETDVVNHIVTKANEGDGFLALYSFIKDALIYPTAYAKVYVEKEARMLTRKLTGLTEDDLVGLVSNPDITLTEYESETITVPMPDEQGMEQPVEVEVYSVSYKERDDQPRLRIISVPGEEVIVDRSFTSLNLDKAPFVAHRARKTYSDLRRMGLKAKDLDAVGSAIDNDEWNEERARRLFYDDEQPQAGSGEEDRSMRPMWVHECWAWIDYNNDGMSEWRHVLMVGDKIFENEPCDYQPMVAMSSSLIPHKHVGMSLAEMVEDLQRLLTTLTRRLLDNTYRINANRKVVSEDSLIEDGTSMEAMLNPIAEWIPVRGSVRDAVSPEQPQSLLAEILPIIQHAQASVSMRSGVAPENSVDPHVLQQSTYGAFMGAMDKASERLELIARVMAETGIKQIFRKAHTLCRMYPDIAQTVRLRGEWIDVDPQSWQDRTDLSINVGLGFNDKRQLLEGLANLLQIQRESMPLGIVKPIHIYNTSAKLIEAGSLGAPEQFFISPNDPEFKPPSNEPSPQDKFALAQADALGKEQQRKMYEAQTGFQLEEAKLRMDAAVKQVELDLKEVEVDKVVVDMEETEASTGLKDAQAVKALADATKARADAKRPKATSSD